jgi:hypothetical protein
VSGCFGVKKITFIDSAQEVSNQQKVTDYNTNKTLKLNFRIGKVSLTSQTDHSEPFKSLKEFDRYILRIQENSDDIYKVVDRNPSKEDLKQAISKSTKVLETIRNIEMPNYLFKSIRGIEDANQWVRKDLESLVVLRIELMDNILIGMKHMNKEIKYKINFLQNTAIPAKESAVNYSRKILMEEEGSQ